MGDEVAEGGSGGAVVPAEGGEGAQLAALYLEEAGGGDAGAVEEGGVLERAGLFDADVEVHGCVCDLGCWLVKACLMLDGWVWL